MKKILILSFIVCNYFIAQSQNVGIGTQTPEGKLHIKGSADTSQLTIDANATQSNTHPLIRLRDASGKDLMHIHSDNPFNTFIGLNAGKSNNATGGGTLNTFTGSYAGYSNTTGNFNAANGSAALYSNTTGHDNTGSGDAALYSNTTGNYNTANASSALYLNSTGSYNTSSGYQSLYSNTTGNHNTATGYNALFNNITGDDNTATGYEALYFNTATGNTAHGYSALAYNTTGTDNTAMGNAALIGNTTGNGNTACGYEALEFNTESYNTAIGESSLYFNTTGNHNIAMGNQSLYLNTYGSCNTAIGNSALFHTIASDYNTALGYNAGNGYDNGFNNVFLGANTDVNRDGYYNVIAIGQGTICTGSSQVTIGNSATVLYQAYANWSNISDGRFKKNIKENVPGLDFIIQLRPVTYNLKATELDAFLHKDIKQAAQLNDKRKGALNSNKPVSQPSNAAAKALYNKALQEKETVVQTGFVAQEVEATAKKMGFNFSGVDAPKDANDVYGLRYAEFVVPLVKAVQEQQVMIKDMQKQIDELKALIKK